MSEELDDLRLTEDQAKAAYCPHHIHKWFFCPWCKPTLVRTPERVRDDISLQACFDERKEVT